MLDTTECRTGRLYVRFFEVNILVAFLQLKVLSVSLWAFMSVCQKILKFCNFKFKPTMIVTVVRETVAERL